MLCAALTFLCVTSCYTEIRMRVRRGIFVESFAVFLLRESDHKFSNTKPYIVSSTDITQVIISLIELATTVNRTVKKMFFLKRARHLCSQF